jgi:glutathione S-transferase
LTILSFQVVIILEELQVPYEIKSVRFEDIKKPPFIDINPNGRAPGECSTLDKHAAQTEKEG